MNSSELTGRTRTHVVEITAPHCVLHEHTAHPFQGLRRAAEQAGFDLVAASGFRDFDRQLDIWNGKFSGRRPMVDAAGSIIAVGQLAPAAIVDAILRWSALPGASRHHWGTDLDLIDAAAVPPGYRVRLDAAEYAAGGVFAPLADWLATHAARFGFFRPFRGILSGVQPEPWHFSFAPVSENARRALTPGVLHAALDAAPLLGKEQVLGRLEELHARYVAAIDWP